MSSETHLPDQPTASASVPVRTRRADRQIRFLAQSVMLEESGTSRLVRTAIYVISGVVGAFVLWAGITPVDEIATSFGQVVPAQSVQQIQHLEGGIVAEIPVHDGQLVEQGDVVLRLDPAAAKAELDQMRARRVGLALRAERLRAIGSGQVPDFSKDNGAVDGQADDQAAIYQTQLKAQENKRAILRQQIEQRRQEVITLESQRKSLREQASILAEEEKMKEGLLARQLTTRTSYLDTKREHARVEGELARTASQLRSSQAALGEAEDKLKELDSSLRETAYNELGQVTSELAQIDEALGKADDRVQRLEMRAPLRGLIQNIKIHTIGAVIPPGGLVMELVPVDQELTVETRISTRDIGHVVVGQAVVVKVVSFDFSRYGGVSGELRKVSPGTLLDEENKPYYKGWVSLQRSYVGADPAKNHIVPGMTVQADIVTGRRTLLQYLLKPIYSSMQNAFRER